MVTKWRRSPEVSGEVLAAAYVRGSSLRELASVHGLAYGTVYRRLTEHGVTMRNRGARRSVSSPETQR